MAALRHSRTPFGLTQDEAILLVEEAEHTPDLRRAVEAATGKAWHVLTTGEKVRALLRLNDVGRGAGALAGAMRGLRDLSEEADRKILHKTVEDHASLLEAEVGQLKEKVDALDKENVKLRRENTELRADAARAVHSGERAA